MPCLPASRTMAPLTNAGETHPPDVAPRSSGANRLPFGPRPG